MTALEKCDRRLRARCSLSVCSIADLKLLTLAADRRSLTSSKCTFSSKH